MSAYEDYLATLETLSTLGERAARAREEAASHGRDELRRAALDRREHEQEWDRLQSKTTRVSRAAELLARNHGVADTHGQDASDDRDPDPLTDLTACGRAVRSLGADLRSAQDLWRTVDGTRAALAAPAPGPAPPAAPVSAPSVAPNPPPAAPAGRAGRTRLLVAAVVLFLLVVGVVVAVTR